MRTISLKSRGFTLVEMLIATTLSAMLIVAALSMLALDHRLYNKQDSMLEATREAQYALEVLERDLLMLGYQVDRNTIADNGPDATPDTDDDIVGQPQIVLARPWELVANMDMAPGIDAILHGSPGDSLPSGYAPPTFFTGAETIRYTLDSSGDGQVDQADRGDEAEELLAKNPGLFLLRREVYGNTGTGNTYETAPVAMIRGPVDYPSGARAQPLFLYWGEFDTDSALDLWGDTGAGGGTPGNGILEAGELAALQPVSDEDLDDDAVLDSGEDLNGNGKLERRVTDLIKKIEVHVTTETTSPDLRYADPVRSSASTPFRYRISALNTQIEPRNIRLAGGECGDTPEPTGSPTVINMCGHPLADGRTRVSWTLSADDGALEQDVERYLIYRTDQGVLFGRTPHAEVVAGTHQWDDDWLDVRAWPPKQYSYRARALDCTPQLSEGDPHAGPYPSDPGPAFPAELSVLDEPADSGQQLRVEFGASPDDPTNTSGYGGSVSEYHVYRSTATDHRCVFPVNHSPVTGTGAGSYSFLDNTANSTSAPNLGQLYYYWVRSRDSSNHMSPYSARACARASAGPTFPDSPTGRIVDHGPGNHPVELAFSQNERNLAAGYDPFLLQYKIYRSHDINADGAADSFVDNSAGYTTDNLVASLAWTGIVWVAGDTGAIHHSIDGGTAWRATSVGAGVTPHAMSFGSRLDGLAVGQGGSIRRTWDGGATWSSMTTTTSTTLRDVAHIDSRRALAVGDDGTVIRTVNGGTTWSQITSGTSANLHGVTAQTNLVVAVGDSGTVLRSEDGGQTFSPVFLSSNPLYGVCSVDQGMHVTLWVGDDAVLWRSTNGGKSWIPTALAGAGEIRGLACAPGGWVVAAGEGHIDVSKNGGLNWDRHGIAGSARDAAVLPYGLAWVVDDSGYCHRRSPEGGWSSERITSGSGLLGVAARPEIVWEDEATAADASGTMHYYVVTAAYSQGDSIDGESGMLPDRPSEEESPDDGLPQILVDSCNNFELAVVTP